MNIQITATSWTTIPVLEFLWGLPYDEIARAYIHALRPSEVRVIDDGYEKSNAVTWRVTVKIEFGVITEIEQEVEVALASGIATNGYELDVALAKRISEKVDRELATRAELEKGY